MVSENATAKQTFYQRRISGSLDLHHLYSTAPPDVAPREEREKNTPSLPPPPAISSFTAELQRPPSSSQPGARDDTGETFPHKHTHLPTLNTPTQSETPLQKTQTGLNSNPKIKNQVLMNVHIHLLPCEDTETVKTLIAHQLQSAFKQRR